MLNLRNCKEVTVNVFDTFPTLSVTLIVILLYVPTDKELNVIVLFPTVAFVVDDDVCNCNSSCFIGWKV